MRSCQGVTLCLSVLAGLFSGCASGHGPARDNAPTVTSDDFRNPNEPIEQVLQRKVPGLQVTRTADGGIALQIRGSSSYRGENTPPLYILNGVPFQPGPGGALTGIDPHDIETIKVLRSAEAGLYGIEGANGVIVITTKQPARRIPE